MSLANKVFIITGGTKGIGKAIAKRVVSDGAKVVLSYSSDSAAASNTLAELGGPDKALIIKADASNLQDIDALVAATVDKFGKIDVVIPNGNYVIHNFHFLLQVPSTQTIWLIPPPKKLTYTKK